MAAQATEDQSVEAEEAESVQAGIPAPLRRHEFLKDARPKADGGDPEQVSVRKLLELWGAGVATERCYRCHLGFGAMNMILSPCLTMIRT